MANAFSNPALFQHFKPVQTENWETAVQLASFKRAEFDKGQEEMNQWMKALASTPIDNIQAKAHFEDRVKTALTEIDKLTTANDISNRGMREQILSSVGGVIDDTTINAISATRSRLNYEAKWEALKKEKPELYNDLNYQYGIAGYNEYINADKDADVRDFVKNRFSVIPYTNIKEIVDKNTMEMIKQKGKKEYTEPIIQTFKDENGDEYQRVIGHRQIVEVGLNDSELDRVLSSSLNDPAIQQQMMINAWDAYGGFSEEGVAKLKDDYVNFVDGLKKSYEAQKEYKESLLESDNLQDDEKERIKKDIEHYNGEILKLPSYLEQAQKEIEAGRYGNASTHIYQNKIMTEGKSKFSTMYSKYQNGVKADEMFWKQQEYDLELSKFSYSQYKDKINWSYKDKELDLKREELTLKKAESYANSGLNPDGTYMMTDEEMNMEEIDPIDFMNNKLKEVGDGVRSSITDIVTLLDDQLRDDNTDEKLKSEATKVKNNYINYLVEGASKKGIKLNKDYMKTLSIKELTEKYEGGEFKGYALYGVVKRSEGTIPNLKLAGGYDILSEARSREDLYKTEFATKETILREKNNIRLENVYTKDLLSSIMTEETNVLSNGKVVKAKVAYKNYLNTDGTWKKGVTESQKNKIIKELDQTYHIQKSGLQHTPVDGKKAVERSKLEAYVKAIGGNIEDIVVDTTPNRSGTIFYSLKAGSKTEILAKKAKGLLHNNYMFGDNTNLAKDNIFSNQIEKGSKLSEVKEKELLANYVNQGLFTEKVAIIPFKNGDGKPNGDATRLALLINNRTGGAKVDMDEATAIRLVQNNNNTYTVRFNTTVDGEKGKISVQESVTFSKDELIRAMPDFAKKMNLDKVKTTPTYTFEKQGFKPLVAEKIGYVDASNKRALEIMSGGDRNIANMIHPYGAMQYISSVHTNAMAFKKFDGLAQKLYDRLTTIENDFKISVKFSSDKTQADVSLVEKEGGKPLYTVQRSLTDGGLDDIKQRIDKTPQLYINEIVAEIIHENYNNSLGLYNRPEFIRLFGKLNIKED